MFLISCDKPKDPRFIDLTGKTFNRWSVMFFSGRDKCGNRIWKCRCNCGTVRNVTASHLKDGVSKSCGCFNLERLSETKTTHGEAGRTAEYGIWAGMITRCTNTKTKRFLRYGGRGIKVCKRWRKYENFLLDMGRRPDGLTLERKNNNGDYSPKNCVWASWTDQQNNRSDNKIISFNGEKLTMAQWSKKTGIAYAAIQRRIRDGWPLERTLTEPATVKKRIFNVIR